MNTEKHRLEDEEVDYPHQELTGRVIRGFYDVYNELGHGFLESVYHGAMVVALRQAGLKIGTKVPLPVYFRGQVVGEFEADLVVEDVVILELKAVRALEPAHETQLLHYLRATSIEIGLLLNFGPSPQVRRRIFDNDRKRHRGEPDARF